jgi:hypothetical protein
VFEKLLSMKISEYNSEIDCEYVNDVSRICDAECEMDRVIVIDAVNDKSGGSSVSVAAGVAPANGVQVGGDVNELDSMNPFDSVNDFDSVIDFDFEKGPVASKKSELAKGGEAVKDGAGGGANIAVGANDAVSFHPNDNESPWPQSAKLSETGDGSEADPAHVPRRTDVVNELVAPISRDRATCPDAPTVRDAGNECKWPNSLDNVTSDPPNALDRELCSDGTNVPDLPNLFDGLKTKDLNRVAESAELDSVRSPE